MLLYLVCMASVVTLPTNDSHVRPALFPHWSARGMYFVEFPITVPRIGFSWLFRSSIFAWIAGSGVTPISQGLCQSAVLYTTVLVLVSTTKRTRVKRMPLL